MHEIIKQLKRARLDKKLKQSELGRKLGLPQSHISKIEQGKSDPRLSTVTDLARLLDQELVLVPRDMLPASGPSSPAMRHKSRNGKSMRRMADDGHSGCVI